MYGAGSGLPAGELGIRLEGRRFGGVRGIEVG